MRKSKKRSDARSNSRLEQPTLFLDRNLGKHIIAGRLGAAGIRVEVHDDHLPEDAKDEQWIQLVARKGWVAVTKDRHIRYRISELGAARRHSARIMVIRMKNATAEQIADLLVSRRRRIALFVGKTPAPFVAGIDRAGSITVYEI